MTQNVGFKEWQVVCDAMGSGRQSIILRKGGIHEGRAGFSFEHSQFFLFPTRFHAQAEKVREGRVGRMAEWELGDPIAIRHHVEVLRALVINDWDRVSALEPIHIYQPETIRERFEWQGKGVSGTGIQIALVRVFELSKPWVITYEGSMRGCRSWIQLPDPPCGWSEGMRPVLAAAEIERIDQLLGA